MYTKMFCFLLADNQGFIYLGLEYGLFQTETNFEEYRKLGSMFRFLVNFRTIYCFRFRCDCIQCDDTIILSTELSANMNTVDPPVVFSY